MQDDYEVERCEVDVENEDGELIMIMQDEDDDDEAEGREVDVENEDGELIMIMQDEEDDDEVEEGREVDVENEDGKLMIMQDEDDDEAEGRDVDVENEDGGSEETNVDGTNFIAAESMAALDLLGKFQIVPFSYTIYTSYNSTSKISSLKGTVGVILSSDMRNSQ